MRRPSIYSFISSAENYPCLSLLTTLRANLTGTITSDFKMSSRGFSPGCAGFIPIFLSKWLKARVRPNALSAVVSNTRLYEIDLDAFVCTQCGEFLRLVEAMPGLQLIQMLLSRIQGSHIQLPDAHSTS